MAVRINLDIKFDKISDELWTDTFNEVVKFVMKTPLGFVRPYVYNDKLFEVYSYPTILKDEHSGFEYIVLSADLNRMTHCEPFRLYSSRELYLNGSSKNEEKEDEWTIWNAKTQRFAYHKYILAAGMLIEHKLGDNAAISGAITENEIQEVKDILKEKLSIDVNTPKRFKLDKSVNRLVDLMLLFGANIGDFVAEKEDCLDFGKYLMKELSEGKLQTLNDESTEELREFILNSSIKHNFVWHQDILEDLISTTNRNILLAYAATLTVDCSSRDAYEYVSRFYKDKTVYKEYIELMKSWIS